MKRSAQMTNLMARYGVTTQAALLRRIRDELNDECFDPKDTDLKWNETTQAYDEVPAKPFTIRDAETTLEGMLEAEYQRIAGGAYDEQPDLVPLHTDETVEEYAEGLNECVVCGGPRKDHGVFVNPDKHAFEAIDPETQALLDATDAILVEAGREDLTMAALKAERERTEMTAKTLPNPIDGLSDDYEDNPTHDPETTKRNKARLAKQVVVAATPAEVKLIATRHPDETAGGYIERVERELGSAYTVWLETDAGQVALKAAATEAAEARKASKQAENKAKAEAAAKRKREIEDASKSGPVEIVQPPTNGKPTKAARQAQWRDLAAKQKEVNRALGVPTYEDGVRMDDAGTPKAWYGPAVAPKPARLVVVKHDTSGLPKETRTKSVKGGNKPLLLGTEPIDVDGVKQYPILHKDGVTLSESQTHNWAWVCPECKKRVRTATCSDAKGRAHAKAPAGYRREDRIVK